MGGAAELPTQHGVLLGAPATLNNGTVVARATRLAVCVLLGAPATVSKEKARKLAGFLFVSRLG
jgi:hypothetical protein